jgi:hypothetical protein
MFPWEKALELASRINDPGTIALFASIIASFLIYSTRNRKGTASRVLSIILAIGFVVLGLTPIIASTLVRLQGLYRVRVVVLGLDGLPVTDAKVVCSTGGEVKKTDAGWEFDIPPQTRPPDGKIVLFASSQKAFLKGSSTLSLGQNYFLTSEIQLTADTSAVVRGIVMDEHRKAVSAATVSISGYPEVVMTDQTGTFVLPAHAAEGQVVQLRAQKGQLIGSLSVPAGGQAPIELVVK